MDGKIFAFFLTAVLSTQVSGQSYRGAVVEYHPFVGSHEKETMSRNTNHYLKFIEEASDKKVDIIVFPEGGLFSKIRSAIPDPAYGISPCESNFHTTETVKKLSCAARDRFIYVVVNLPEERKCEVDDPNCPKAGHYVFNTNVVFDRTGVVIARYAKYNLFASDTADKPPEPEMSFFDTDFGVRFGTFICFDILFPFPAQRLIEQYGIRDFVFSTFWFSEMPFLTALQAQRGWAETNHVNLLASGVNFPILGSSGSGIYNGKYGHLVQYMPEKETSRLLIANIPKFNSSCNTCPSPFYHILPTEAKTENFSVTVEQMSEGESKPFLNLLRDPGLKNYSTEIIKQGQKFEQKICSYNEFCCDFTVMMTGLKPESKNYTYRAVVYNGVREFGAKFRGGAQICEIIVCGGPKVEDCGQREKKISGLMPSTLTDGPVLLPIPAYKYEFSKTVEDSYVVATMELLWPVTDVYAFGIWGRDFTRDNGPIESSASTMVSAPILFGAFISFLMFVR